MVHLALARRRCLTQALILGAGFVVLAGRGQVFGPVKGFKLADPHPPPHDTQIKSLLKAETAIRLPDGQVALTNAILDTYRETGQADLIAKAGFCLCNPETHSANSPGALEAGTADGKFTIVGEGFLWQQTNACLIISNRVRTAAQPDLKISADLLVYWADLGLGFYSGNVHVEQGTNWNLTAGTVTFKVPRTERQLQEVTADTNVVVDYPPLHATCGHATYSADTGLVRMTGQPRWRADQREGSGDELVIDRTNKIFQANGHAWLKLPGRSLEGFLSNSNASAGPSLTATNQFIEVLSESYEARTNWGVFRGGVRLEERAGSEVRGTMSCGLLTVSFSGTNELHSLVAETNVVIEQEDKRFTGGKAVYTATNGILELTQSPNWQAGPRSGKGDLLRMNQARNEMVVKGHASVRLPAGELGQSAVSGPAATSKAVTNSTAAQIAEIFCEQYMLRPTNLVFRGGVYATHPQMNWSGETVTVLLPAPETKVIIAEQAVVFDLLDKGQKVHGIGDKAVYTNSVATLYTGGVKTMATNDIVTLTGVPAELTTTNGTIQSSIIICDRGNNKLSTGPDYRLKGAAPTEQTNLFPLPKIKVKK